MTKDTKKTSNTAAMAAGAIGSAAIAGALLYAGRHFAKKRAEKAPDTQVPSGENPETD